jgi:hypothetical protein
MAMKHHRSLSSSASQRPSASEGFGRGRDTGDRSATHQRRERLQKEQERLELRWARENRLA